MELKTNDLADPLYTAITESLYKHMFCELNSEIMNHTQHSMYSQLWIILEPVLIERIEVQTRTMLR